MSAKSDKPSVMVVTDVSQLIERVAQYWPRHKLSPQAGALILRKFCRHAILTVLEALDRFYGFDPDADRPDWRAIESLLRTSAAPKRDSVRDEASWVRACWRGYGQRMWPHQIELLSDENSDRVPAQDLVNWRAAEQACILFRGYVLRPDERVPKASAAGAQNIIERAHFAVRNLREWGLETRRWKAARLEDIEIAAERLGIKLERVAMPEGPF